MLTWLRNVITSLLWDEAAAQRYVAGGAYLLGKLLSSGGTIPGTSSVLPLPHAEMLSQIGPWLEALGVFMGAGGMLPTLKGNATPQKS